MPTHLIRRFFRCGLPQPSLAASVSVSVSFSRPHWFGAFSSFHEPPLHFCRSFIDLGLWGLFARQPACLLTVFSNANPHLVRIVCVQFVLVGGNVAPCTSTCALLLFLSPFSRGTGGLFLLLRGLFCSILSYRLLLVPGGTAWTSIPFSCGFS